MNGGFMKKHIIFSICLNLSIVNLLIAGGIHIKKSIPLKPDKVINLKIADDLLNDPRSYFYYNRYKKAFFYAGRKKFIVVSQNGVVQKRYLVKNAQAPGGFESVLGMQFYPDCFLIFDYCKVVKFDYSYKFVSNVVNGMCFAMGYKWVSKDGKKVIFYTNNQGFGLIENGKLKVRNEKLKINMSLEDTSMMNFFKEYKCVYDEYENSFYAAEIGRYIVYKLNPDNLEILQKVQVFPANFKMADYKKQGVYHFMGVEEYYKLLNGICEVENISYDKDYVYVRWGERIGHQSYVDVFRKKDFSFVVEYKLEKTHKDNNRFAAFSDGDGVLFVDDLIENDESGSGDKRFIMVYDLRKRVLKFFK